MNLPSRQEIEREIQYRAELLREVRPQQFCFECDNHSRCASAEKCYGLHVGYPKTVVPEGLDGPHNQIESNIAIEAEVVDSEAMR